jgi:hypothetical protein
MDLVVTVRASALTSQQIINDFKKKCHHCVRWNRPERNTFPSTKKKKTYQNAQTQPAKSDRKLQNKLVILHFWLNLQYLHLYMLQTHPSNYYSGLSRFPYLILALTSFNLTFSEVYNDTV